MNALLVLTWLALCVLLFLICRVPFNRWTATTAVLVGIALLAGLVPALNYFHPYSSAGQHRAFALPIAATAPGRVSEILVEEDQRVRRGDPLFRIEIAAGHPAAAQLEDPARGSSAATVRAPADGYIDELNLTRGARLSVDSAEPPLLFVRDDGRLLVAWFRQRDALRLARGGPTEVAFDAIPGVVFGGRIERLLPAHTFIRDDDPSPHGWLPVVIEISDPRFDAHAQTLPAGTAARAVAYGERLPQLAVVRRVVLRMTSWLDFILPVG